MQIEKYTLKSSWMPWHRLCRRIFGKLKTVAVAASQTPPPIVRVFRGKSLEKIVDGGKVAWYFIHRRTYVIKEISVSARPILFTFVSRGSSFSRVLRFLKTNPSDGRVIKITRKIQTAEGRDFSWKYQPQVGTKSCQLRNKNYSFRMKIRASFPRYMHEWNETDISCADFPTFPTFQKFQWKKFQLRV